MAVFGGEEKYRGQARQTSGETGVVFNCRMAIRESHCDPGTAAFEMKGNGWNETGCV
jgi:hypothetical protein